MFHHATAFVEDNVAGNATQAAPASQTEMLLAIVYGRRS